MAVFMIKSLGQLEEYVDIDTDFSEIQRYCRKSEVQFLNKEKISVGTLESGGIEFPDLIFKSDVLLLSDYLFQHIKCDIEDYVFFKPVEVNCDVIGKKEKYWILVPPRIDCLDLDNSRVNFEWDFDLGIIPVLESEKIVIDEDLTGYFMMFKVLGIDDSSVYVKKELVNKIKGLNPEGIKFVSC